MASPHEVIFEQGDRTAEITRDLIRFDTSNYGGGRSNGEEDAANYVAEKLSALGLKPQIFEPEPGRTSVVARVQGKNAEKDALVLHGHLDVVPANADDWSVDPFGAEVRDGMIWGRGAVDMKNMNAMILVALENILNAGKQPARDVVVAFFADEEAGGVLGSHYLVREHPELFHGATEAISEVGGYSIELNGQRAYLLQTGEKALLWIKLIAYGRGGHGSSRNDENAITRLAAAVSRIGAYSWPVRLRKTTTQLLEQIAHILGDATGSLSAQQLALSTGTASQFISASLQTTSNPTVITAGNKHNVIPDRAEALIDVRVLPGEEDEVLSQIRELAGEGIYLEVVHQDCGLENDFSGGLVDHMTQSLGRFDPDAVVLPYLFPGGTDNKALSLLGVKGYGFVPLNLPKNLDFPALFHGVDERVPLEALKFGTNVLTDLLVRY